jgi:hypothetical protein
MLHLSCANVGELLFVCLRLLVCYFRMVDVMVPGLGTLSCAS